MSHIVQERVTRKIDYNAINNLFFLAFCLKTSERRRADWRHSFEAKRQKKINQ